MRPSCSNPRYLLNHNENVCLYRDCTQIFIEILFITSQITKNNTKRTISKSYAHGFLLNIQHYELPKSLKSIINLSFLYWRAKLA